MSDSGGKPRCPPVRAGMTGQPVGEGMMRQDDAAVPATASGFGKNGAALHRGAAISILHDLRAMAGLYPPDQPGIRLKGDGALARHLSAGPVHDIAVGYLGIRAQPVRAILFDKTATANWSLAWHQDRTIVVRERHDVPGFGPWSRKAGLAHVEPPFVILEGMVTLRIHLDDVPPDNAPLLIAPGSHRLGRVPEGAIAAAVEQCGSFACVARAGDIWAYATAILHASATAIRGRRRRVLQVDYAAAPLPAPLAWHGL